MFLGRVKKSWNYAEKTQKKPDSRQLWRGGANLEVPMVGRYIQMIDSNVPGNAPAGIFPSREKCPAGKDGGRERWQLGKVAAGKGGGRERWWPGKVAAGKGPGRETWDRESAIREMLYRGNIWPGNKVPLNVRPGKVWPGLCKHRGWCGRE